MDSLRGKFGMADGADDGADWDTDDEYEQTIDAAPPTPVGQDERRMQVRAYNYWASLLGERSYPSVEDIEPDNLPDFAENSVLLDFTSGVENPAITFLGDRLKGECGNDGEIETLADVPARSLLSRITDHYMQILANEAPVGFEAEFINQHGLTILYRGILLPFSTDDETIDFIYGVINWKEVADQLTTDELLLEIDHALDAPMDEDDDDTLPVARMRAVVSPSITRWADGPGNPELGVDEDGGDIADDAAGTLPSPTFARLDAHLGMSGHTAQFGQVDEDEGEDEDSAFDPLAALRAPAGYTGGLHQCLADARALAQQAHSCEMRSRAALYQAIGRAYDVSIAAAEEPEAFEELLAEQDIAATPRAPMTPVVKLVFGADYDKSRLAEYAAVLACATREGVPQGGLADVLESTTGGIKALIARERALRRPNGAGARQTGLAKVHRQLDLLDPRPLAAIPAEGARYALCMIRRGESGEIDYLGEVADDQRMLARAAKQLVG